LVEKPPPVTPPNIMPLSNNCWAFITVIINTKNKQKVIIFFIIIYQKMLFHKNKITKIFLVTNNFSTFDFRKIYQKYKRRLSYFVWKSVETIAEKSAKRTRLKKACFLLLVFNSARLFHTPSTCC